MTATAEQIQAQLAAPIAAVDGLDLSDADAAAAALEQAFPAAGTPSIALRQYLLAAVADGVICDRGNDAIRYSRLAKAGPKTGNCSIDFVWMTGPGINHRHPQGEVNLCFAVEGDPRFDGKPQGWVVFAPGSQHVPTVTGGRMLIVYFLPDGAVEWINAGKA